MYKVNVRGFFEDSARPIEVGGLSGVLGESIQNMDDAMFLRFCKVAEAALVKHPTAIKRLLTLDEALCKEILLRNATRVPVNRDDYRMVIPSNLAEYIKAIQASTAETAEEVSSE